MIRRVFSLFAPSSSRQEDPINAVIFDIRRGSTRTSSTTDGSSQRFQQYQPRRSNPKVSEMPHIPINIVRRQSPSQISVPTQTPKQLIKKIGIDVDSVNAQNTVVFIVPVPKQTSVQTFVQTHFEKLITTQKLMNEIHPEFLSSRYQQYALLEPYKTEHKHLKTLMSKRKDHKFLIFILSKHDLEFLRQSIKTKRIQKTTRHHTQDVPTPRATHSTMS